eukprot:547354_1
MSLLLMFASISYMVLVNSQCGIYTCSPSSPPNTNCGGQPQVEWRCDSFSACFNEESECAACCHADKLFNDDPLFAQMNYNNASELFNNWCYQDACRTHSPSQPTSAPSQPTSAPTSHPSQPTDNPSVTPSISPTSHPSQHPSQPTDNPSVTPSISPSVFTSAPNKTPSVIPSTSPVESPVKSSSEGNGNEMISIIIPIVYVIIAFIVVY